MLANILRERYKYDVVEVMSEALRVFEIVATLPVCHYTFKVAQALCRSDETIYATYTFVRWAKPLCAWLDRRKPIARTDDMAHEGAQLDRVARAEFARQLVLHGYTILWLDIHDRDALKVLHTALGHMMGEKE